eukprot:GHVT01103566.1.p1 GENE.GHVT01103566.1~~GHVT01103566.1.p1  ORF type:complete len:399 (+),score=106.93 GHVT01103566.1:3220-4416(+)
MIRNCAVNNGGCPSNSKCLAYAKPAVDPDQAKRALRGAGRNAQLVAQAWKRQKEPAILFQQCYCNGFNPASRGTRKGLYFERDTCGLYPGIRPTDEKKYLSFLDETEEKAHEAVAASALATTAGALAVPSLDSSVDHHPATAFVDRDMAQSFGELFSLSEQQIADLEAVEVEPLFDDQPIEVDAAHDLVQPNQLHQKSIHFHDDYEHPAAPSSTLASSAPLERTPVSERSSVSSRAHSSLQQHGLAAAFPSKPSAVPGRTPEGSSAAAFVATGEPTAAATAASAPEDAAEEGETDNEVMPEQLPEIPDAESDEEAVVAHPGEVSLVSPEDVEADETQGGAEEKADEPPAADAPTKLEDQPVANEKSGPQDEPENSQEPEDQLPKTASDVAKSTTAGTT